MCVLIVPWQTIFPFVIISAPYVVSSSFFASAVKAIFLFTNTDVSQPIIILLGLVSPVYSLPICIIEFVLIRPSEYNDKPLVAAS